MRVYVAGVYEDRNELRRELEEALRLLGLHGRLEIVSRWLHRDGEPSPEAWIDREFVDLDDRERRIAVEDVQDIQSADVLVLDTRSRALRGGREVEYGLALAYKLPVVRVGPARNIFHGLASYVCEDLIGALEWISQRLP